MESGAARKYLYADPTWPKVNDAVDLQKVILLPIGPAPEAADLAAAIRAQFPTFELLNERQERYRTLLAMRERHTA